MKKVDVWGIEMLFPFWILSFIRRSKKKYMFSVPARFLFWGRVFFSSSLFIWKNKKNTIFPPPPKKKKKKKKRKKDCMLYRKIAFYIFRLPHQLFHLLWKLSRMSGGHLKKIGWPVVLENVSGGHFEEEKKAPPPSFFPQRQDAKHVLFFYFALIWCNL